MHDGGQLFYFRYEIAVFALTAYIFSCTSFEATGKTDRFGHKYARENLYLVSVLTCGFYVLRKRNINVFSTKCRHKNAFFLPQKCHKNLDKNITKKLFFLKKFEFYRGIGTQGLSSLWFGEPNLYPFYLPDSTICWYDSKSTRF